jgi:molybdopterin converting factor small subunit
MKSVLTPQEYFDKIKPLRNSEEIKAVCEELTTGLFNETDKPKTRTNKLTPYNKLVKTLANEELLEGENAYIQTKQDGTLWKRHLHFKFTGLADTAWYDKEVIKEDGTKETVKGINTKTVVLDRLDNRRKVEVTSYLEIVSKLLLSDDPHELAVGLIAASGRRPVEILIRGSFKLISDLPNYLKPGYFVQFKGQAKKRDYEMPEAERTEYRVGVLVPAESFLAAFKRFRLLPETKELLELLKAETKKGTDPEVINDMIESRRGNSLRRVVVREFGSFLPARHGETEINNKALRAVYVRLITDRDCPKNMTELLWASRAVGHFVDAEKPDDSQLGHLLTTLGYFDYYADSEVPFMPVPHKPEREKTMQVRVFANDCEQVRQLQKDWELPNQQTVVRNLIELALKNKELENQLLDAQAKIAQLEQEKTEMTASQPKPTPEKTEDLQGMVKQMIAEALAEVIPTIQYPQQVKTETTQLVSQRQPKAKPETPEKDWESVSSEELKVSKHRGAAEEKIRRSFSAITNHNDHKARDNNGQPDVKKMWAITNQALRQLSGCNGQLVADWMQRYHGAIDDHNAKYGLGQYHNKGKGHIAQVINW